MTDREKLIELIGQVQYLGGLELALADHLLANGVRLELKQATSDENKRWIPVSERLPEKMKEVLVWSHGGDFAEVAFWAGGRWEKAWDHEVIYTVTHWMPLPEAPKEE